MSKKYSLSCIVEFEDVDCYGIAHHGKLINYLERARVRLLGDEGVQVVDGNFNLVMANMTTKFLKPAKMLDRLDVVVWVGDLRPMSITWNYEIKKDDTVLMRAEVRQASVNSELKLTRIPENIEQILKKYCPEKY